MRFLLRSHVRVSPLLDILYFTRLAFSPCATRSRGPSSIGMNNRFRYYEKALWSCTEVVLPDCVVVALLLQHQPVGVAFSWPQNIFPTSCCNPRRVVGNLVFRPVISWQLSCWKIIVTRKRAGKHVHEICKNVTENILKYPSWKGQLWWDYSDNGGPAETKRRGDPGKLAPQPQGQRVGRLS